MLDQKRRKKLQAVVDRDDEYRNYRDDDVEIRNGRKKGRGLFAVRRFLPGELVIEVTGQLVRERDYEGSEFVMELEGDWLLEPNVPGAYVNHSCNPNSELIQLTKYSMGIVATCNIEEGTEICFDYGWPAEDWIPACRCAAPNCRGWVVAEDQIEKMRRIAARLARKRKKKRRKSKV